MIEIFILLILTFLVCWHLSIKNRLAKVSFIPGPSGVPIFGNFFFFAFKNVEEVTDSLFQMAINYGGVYKVYAFNNVIIVAADPNNIQEILSSSKYIEKNFIYELLRSWLGDGLLLSKGSKWHSRRKIITPTFHFKILEQFLRIFHQQGTILVDKLNEFCDNDDDENENGNDNKKSIDIHKFIALATLDVIAESAMGIKINAQTDSNCEYVTAISDISQAIAKRFIKSWLRNDLVCYLLKNSLWTTQQKALKILHKFTEKIIIERRNLLLENGGKQSEIILEDENNLDIGLKKRMAFLDVLLNSNINGKPLTNSDIREEVDTFMFEGHDTTTAALCFTLSVLSRHADVQNKVFNEIVQIIGNDTKKLITYQNLQDFKYMELVIKESLRMYPPVAIIGRVMDEDALINGKIIPANTPIIIHLQALMRNPKVFNDPNTFNPDRFLNIFDEQQVNFKDGFNPYAYVPFSAGPRNCIGQKFAMLELKSIICKILINFELLPRGPDVHPLMDIILKSKTGFHLGLRKRKLMK